MFITVSEILKFAKKNKTNIQIMWNIIFKLFNNSIQLDIHNIWSADLENCLTLRI